MARLRFAVLAFVCTTACGGTPASPSVAGQWGGDHITLTVGDAASHVEFDCAHGDFTGDISSSSFSLAGTFVREHGGPIRDDETADSHPALYSGAVNGSSMTLMLRLTDSNEIVGTFTLTRGAAGHIVKCL